jgi:hypothetical protein
MLFDFTRIYVQRRGVFGILEKYEAEYDELSRPSLGHPERVVQSSKTLIKSLDCFSAFGGSQRRRMSKQRLKAFCFWAGRGLRHLLHAGGCGR